MPPKKRKQNQNQKKLFGKDEEKVDYSHVSDPWLKSFLDPDSPHHQQQHVKEDDSFGNYYYTMARKYFPNGCNICSSLKTVILTDSSIVYGKSYGMIYFCTNCRSYVGVHDNPNNDHGETNAPKGTLADAELRNLRKIAHKYFDPLWQNTTLKKSKAYSILKNILNVSKERAHIAMLTKYELRLLIHELQKFKVNRHEQEPR